MKMTKKAMVDFIETTGCLLTFNRNRLMRANREYVQRIYDFCLKHNQKANNVPTV